MPPYLPLVEWDDGAAISPCNFATSPTSSTIRSTSTPTSSRSGSPSSRRCLRSSSATRWPMPSPARPTAAHDPADAGHPAVLDLVPAARLCLAGFLRSNGVINNFLLWTGIIDQPLVMLQTDFAVYVGIVYTYLPFMILPLYTNLVKLDESLLEASADLGARPAGDLLPRHPAALDARRHRRLHAGLHPGDRRVRHSLAARRPGHADDRPRALGRVLLQPRLAGGRGAWPSPCWWRGHPDHAAAQRPGRVEES